jgi:hypothetical protein
LWIALLILNQPGMNKSGSYKHSAPRPAKRRLEDEYEEDSEYETEGDDLDGSPPPHGRREDDFLDDEEEYQDSEEEADEEAPGPASDEEEVYEEVMTKTLSLLLLFLLLLGPEFYYTHGIQNKMH